MYALKGTKIFFLGLMITLNSMYEKASAVRNAYATNIKTCLFDHWPGNILTSTPTCSGSNQSPLCYSSASPAADPADFISCYNTGTLIPDYTAHLLAPITANLTRPKSAWKDDKGSNSMYLLHIYLLLHINNPTKD